MNPKLIQGAALLLAALLVWGASSLQKPINESRAGLSMITTANPLESAPPEYAFAIQAFGAFRGLLTNIAFIRAEELKQQGKYYDAMQLASWVCKLQPHFPAVWEFLAWNMAWNISVTTYTPEERWNWVYNGVKLLRDEGRKANPRSINIYKNLAWIFVNKMSESTDEHHLAYKRNWAWRMHLVLGVPPDPLGDYHPEQAFEALDGGIGSEIDLLSAASRVEAKRREIVEKAKREAAAGGPAVVDINVQVDAAPAAAADTFEINDGYQIVRKAAFDYIKSIADAPATLPALYEKNPAAREMVARLRDLEIYIGDDELTEEKYWRDDGLAFTFFYPYRLLNDPPSLLRKLLDKPEQEPRAATAEKMDKIMGVTTANPDGVALARFLQKKVLAEVYKMQAARMADLMEIFGPMDWRVVDTASLYWLNEGLVAGQETISTFRNDKTNTTRLVFFSLRNLYHRNRLVFEPYTENVNYSYINFNPDLNFIEPMHQAFLRYGKDIDPVPTDKGVGDTFKTGHVSFLIESMRLLYFAGRKKEAEHYYDYLRVNYGKNDQGVINPHYLLTLDELVKKTWEEDALGSWQQTRDAMGAMIMSAFENLSQGNVAIYRNNMEWARQVRHNYNKDIPDNGDKIRTVPFEDLQSDVLLSMYMEPAVSPLQTVMKARLWRALPLSLRQSVYDDAVPLLVKEAEVMGFDVAKAFPEPPGMEDYRKTHPRRGPDQKETNVHTPAQSLQ